MTQYEEQLLSFGHGGRYITLQFNKSTDVQYMSQLLACVYVIYKGNYSAKFLFILKPIPEEEILLTVSGIMLSCRSAQKNCLRTSADRASAVSGARWAIPMQIEVRMECQFTYYLFIPRQPLVINCMSHLDSVWKAIFNIFNTTKIMATA